MNHTADEMAKGIMPDLGPEEFGKEYRLGFSSDGHEQRVMVTAIAECPSCGKDVALFSHTDAWTEEEGRWVHSEYSCPMGVCCKNLIVDGFERCEVYDLGNQQAKEERKGDWYSL